MCISLIQEQVARQSALMMGISDEVVELDQIEIVPRQKNFLGNEDSPGGPTTAVVIPDASPDKPSRPATVHTLPGETLQDDAEEENDDDSEESDESAGEEEEEEEDDDEGEGDEEEEEKAEDGEEDDEGDDEDEDDSSDEDE